MISWPKKGNRVPGEIGSSDSGRICSRIRVLGWARMRDVGDGFCVRAGVIRTVQFSLGAASKY